MTQADTPTWSLTFQLKLMAALDAAWAMLESASDPAVIRQVRDRAKAIGDLAAMARKVVLITPRDRAKPSGPTLTDTVAAGLRATQGEAQMGAMLADVRAMAAPEAAPARRALDKLKGGRRGRL